MSKQLAPFDGRDVVGTSIKVTKAGDGLSTAMKSAPAEYHTGEKVYVVIETTVGPIRHVPSKDNDQAYIREHTLIAGVATVVDFTLVKVVLDEQVKKNEQATGVERLPGMDGSADPPRGNPLGGPTPIGDLAKKAAGKAAAATKKGGADGSTSK